MVNVSFLVKDCANGGRKKAETAAESLRLIFPGVNAQSVALSIPMPGHSVGTSGEFFCCFFVLFSLLLYLCTLCIKSQLETALKTLKEEIKQLEELVSSHDAVFLLMDTRESRWLPTVMCTAMSKICVNAALGFDTYMVMRHGFRLVIGVMEKEF